MHHTITYSSIGMQRTSSLALMLCLCSARGACKGQLVSEQRSNGPLERGKGFDLLKR